MKRLDRPVATLVIAGTLFAMGTPVLAGVRGEEARSVGSVATVSAPAAPNMPREDVGLLDDFGIVRGDADGNMNLDRTITRAEMIKVMVAATGLEDIANLMKGVPAFKDTADHWASGYIAMAEAVGYTEGYPDGTFQPERQVTYEEVVALVARVAGMEPDSALSWPMSYIEPAVTSGIIPADLDVISKLGTPAPRRDAFTIADLAFRILKGEDGKTVYQRHFDSIPPVVKLDPVPASTTAHQLTIAGVALDVESVTVGGAAVPVGGDGRFSATVDLGMGANTIEVRACDAVGNEEIVTVRVERVAAESQEG